MQRVTQLVDHLRPSGVSKLQAKQPDDVVIVLACRSPLCKARRGAFKDTRADELLTAFFKAVLQKFADFPRPLAPELVDDITVGRVLGQAGAYEARAAALAAGFPDTTTCQTQNRFCSSGLMAVQSISNAIRNDEIDIGLAVGFESMTANPDRGAAGFSDEIMAHPVARDCLLPMGHTSENVASEFNISRERMDELAAMSHQRASEAQRAGKFAAEIVPVEVFRAAEGSGQQKDGKDSTTGPRQRVLIREDDGIRHGTTKESLAKVKPAFPQWGKGATTGGNASQLTDGAAAVLMMKRRKAEELGLPILAKHIATVTAGLPPRIMGIGPTFAIPKLLKLVGIDYADVDLWEVNEAFASMFVYCTDKLALPLEKVNVNGGAIAFGHPLGCTGARQIATGLSEIRKRKGKILCTSMCIGTGQGAAGLFVAEY